MEQRWPTTLVLVRHGESERNVKREQARGKPDVHHYHEGLRDIDVKLTERGLEQARETGKSLAEKFAFDVAFVSPYTRTVQTAETMLGFFDPKPQLVRDERIREVEFGILDGLTNAGIKNRFPGEWERKKREGTYWYRPPGGESRPDVALRVNSFLNTMTRDYPGSQILVVCHSVVVLVFRRLLERWGEEEYLKVNREDDVKNCSMTAYRYDNAVDKLVLDEYNTVCYLE
jgi:broad specificity phosphatase PhoE